MIENALDWIGNIALIFGLIVLLLEVIGVSLPKIDTLGAVALSYGGVWLVTGSWVFASIFALIFGLLFHFLVYPYLLKAATSSSPSERSMEGKRAEVITAIPERGCGEVMVLGDLSKLTFIAEGYNGQAISSGVEVVIVDIQDGIAKVTELNTDLL